MVVAQRFTTEYVDHEDRMRVSAALPGDEVAVMWLTKRLLDRLVLHLASLLEQQTAQAPLPEVQQTFAQQAAIVSHVQNSKEQQQVPVQPQKAQTVREWLVLEVDITPAEHGVSLRFRGAQADQKIELGMPAVLLRQWLAIVHGQYKRAQWPLDSWPTWMNDAVESATVTDKPGLILH